MNGFLGTVALIVIIITCIVTICFFFAVDAYMYEIVKLLGGR